TGGTGLLGGHVLFALLQTHDRVTAMKRSAAKTDTLREIFSYYTDDPDSLMDRIDWRTGDMLVRESLWTALEGVSAIVNCAAIVSFDPHDRKRLIENNIEGARNLADAIRRERLQNPDIRLIHVSSTSALGDGPGNDPGFLIDEETIRSPERRHSGYSVSKFESEKILKELREHVVVLNPGIILGPGQWNKGSSQLFAKGWQGIKYYPYGGNGYVDVRDVAGIIDALLDSAVSGQRFCVVGANLRFREFFNQVTDEYGKPNPSIYAGKFLSGLAWRADTFHARLTGRNPLLTRETAESAQRISFYSSVKIQNKLGYRFRPVSETIRWVAGCYRKHIAEV
ncbi:MAG: NAD-dependent epimerase/dehydratase family protein, partial [Bacteroidales bacterium]|nr:NAD-dependent epimerase/dehydratase family protein [Bacteroidales bacterium]